MRDRRGVSSEFDRREATPVFHMLQLQLLKPAARQHQIPLQHHPANETMGPGTYLSLLEWKYIPFTSPLTWLKQM